MIQPASNLSEVNFSDIGPDYTSPISGKCRLILQARVLLAHQIVDCRARMKIRRFTRRIGSPEFTNDSRLLRILHINHVDILAGLVTIFAHRIAAEVDDTAAHYLAHIDIVAFGSRNTR